MRKKGFTLAETLIILLIIGVVAAITIPVFVENHKKEVLHKQFLKTYSDLNKFAEKFMADEGMSFSEYCAAVDRGRYDTYTTERCLNKFETYFSIIKRISSEEYLNDFDYELYTIYGKKLDKKIQYNFTMCDGKTLVQDANGRFFRMHKSPYGEFYDSKAYNYADGPNGPRICVDTNGQLGPNRYGFDYFVFMFTIDGKVIPFGAPDKNNPTCSEGYNLHINCGGSLNEKCSKITSDPNPPYSEYACSYYALLDKSPENPNKTYWKDHLKF